MFFQGGGLDETLGRIGLMPFRGRCQRLVIQGKSESGARGRAELEIRRLWDNRTTSVIHLTMILLEQHLYTSGVVVVMEIVVVVIFEIRVDIGKTSAIIIKIIKIAHQKILEKYHKAVLLGKL